ncbi:head morphogenesis protein [Shewanella yunxiaonensis]|uniref:Head morphogenesis protein n=1 Tax=Shewanella yunxiaonensis TaxID=2829809 RepID=A0ABX7YVW9_9GAMM|nr:PBECR2 nuclease fold domain-containing protein [Shewanella yunxiaonensis]QUN06439.1 head morphogenesis protein [Shewanella yunxiaonensis]
MPETQYGSVQFQLAIDFFRGKLNLPTAAWDDIWGGMHSRAFVVAGAQKADLLTDLRQSVDAAIADGMSLGEFKKQFKDIVAKHGWDHKGNADWRSQIIYDTNMRQSYNTGRWQQLQQFEYWQYKHGHPSVPRQDHLSWNDLILPATSPWWKTHFPQNGWGCTCSVRGLTAEQIKRRGLVVSQEPGTETYEWSNQKTGEVLDIPKGIDPGFDYSPGEVAFGKQLNDQAMAQWQHLKADAWEQLTPGNWKTAGLAAALPVNAIPTALGSHVTSVQQLTNNITHLFGAAEVVLEDGPLPVYINAASLAAHMKDDLGRAPYITWLIDLLKNPDETWATFERHKGTGKIELRVRMMKVYKDKKGKALLLVTQVNKGLLEAWTMMPSDVNYINKQRRGILIGASTP